MPHSGEPYGSCPRCGARTERFQEYCLECGERLPRTVPPRRLTGLPLGDRLGPVVALLGLTIVATAAAVAAEPGSSGTPIVTATQPVTVGPGSQTSVTLTYTATGSTTTSAPAPTLTTGTLPTAPGETGTAPTTPATTAQPLTTTATAPAPTVAGGLVTWPAGHGGYTDVLASVPVSAGRAAADSQARSAARGGLPQVGVLSSSDWSSLHAGYYVVFSGIYSSPDAATSALAGAHAKGYPSAYSARVSP